MSDYSEATPFVGLSTVETTHNHPEVSRELAITVAQAASERKAGDIVILRVAEVSYVADYFVLVTGYSRPQVRAIAGAIADQVEQEWQQRPLRTEGQAEGNWLLLDYGDVIVHIMSPKEREFYNLEAFWGHAERIDPTSGVSEELAP